MSYYDVTNVTDDKYDKNVLCLINIIVGVHSFMRSLCWKLSGHNEVCLRIINPYPAECNYCDFGKLSSLC